MITTMVKNAPGPLVVSKTNPRHFTVESGKSAEREAIYLTGSHIWNKWQDRMGPGSDCAETRKPFDSGEYLDYLEKSGHNLIRIWGHHPLLMDLRLIGHGFQ